MHFRQKLAGDLKAGLITNNAVNPAMGTKCCLRCEGFRLVSPLFDLPGLKDPLAMEATAHGTAFDFLAMIDRFFVRDTQPVVFGQVGGIFHSKLTV